MNMNYSFLTTMYERDIRIHTVVTSDGAGKITYHKKRVKIVTNIFDQKYVHLGEKYVYILVG